MKKGILILLLVILILVIILGIKILAPKENKTYTAAELKTKILSAFDYTNYTYEYVQDGEKTVKKVKGNIIVTENDKNYTWIDGEENTLISINKEDKKYASIDLNSTTKELMYKKDFLDMPELLDIYGNKIYYIDTENYKGKSCLRIQAGEDKATYLVDEETGFILKYEPGDGGSVAEFDIELNNVTEEDVKMPDLSGYTRAGS